MTEMKPQTITLTHLPNILLVVLPEGHKYYRVQNSLKTPGKSTFIHSTEGVAHFDDLPQGNWRIVSTLADLTEQQAHGLVDWDEDELYYKVYDAHPITHDNGQTTIRPGCLDALESLHSAIRASGWYLENIYPDINDPKFYDEPYDGSGFYQELYSGALDDWKQRQSRTLNPELTLILERK